MPRSIRLAECAASLLEVDPGLVRVLGVRDASANGHRRVIPVLTIDAGEWSPPSRDDLGTGTVALAVLDGWLTDGEVLIGARDTFDAWTERWTVCTSVRMAVIGDAFAGALRTWPNAAPRAPTAPRTRVPAKDGPIEERVLELLWRIALRWGRSAAGTVALPESLDLRALSLILGVGELEAGLALAKLEERGVRRLAGALHLQLLGGSGVPRRDTLRGAATRQLALARAARDDCLALCELLDVGLRGRAARIPTQKTSTRPDRVRASQVRASTGGAAGGRIPTKNGRSAPRPRGQRQVLGHRVIGVRSLPDNFLPPSFRCDVEPGGDGAVRIRPVGELDMSTVPVLERAMAQARVAGHQLLVVDLRELEFMDSTGLTLLTRWSLGSERDGYDLALVAGSDRIQRLFELTRLITHFKFVDG